MTALASWPLTLLHLVTAADPVPDDSEVQPGPWMAVVILLLVAVSVFLWFSMRKQLGRIRVPRRDEPDDAAEPDTRAPGTHDTQDGDGRPDARPEGPPVS